MPPSFLGFDHIDCRVRSLAAVESFYDALMPLLGLSHKRYAFVDAHGDWHERADSYNTVEYYEAEDVKHARHFVGFIEDSMHRINATRVAFRVDHAMLDSLERVLVHLGAQNIERSEDMESYPAIFFEDPSGTKLEFIGR